MNHSHLTFGSNLTGKNAVNYCQSVPICHCTHRVVVQHELDCAELHQLPYTAVRERQQVKEEKPSSHLSVYQQAEATYFYLSPP